MISGHRMHQLPLYAGTAASCAYSCSCGHITIGSSSSRAPQLVQLHLADPSKTPRENLAIAIGTPRPAGRRVLTRRLTMTFTVGEDCTLTGQELQELGDRIVSEQIDPDPPVLTFDHVEVTTIEELA